MLEVLCAQVNESLCLRKLLKTALGRQDIVAPVTPSSLMLMTFALLPQTYLGHSHT